MRLVVVIVVFVVVGARIFLVLGIDKISVAFADGAVTNWSLPSPSPSSCLSRAGESVYAGPGAGRYPTANSVVNDVVRLSRLGVEGTRNPFPIEKSWELEPDFEACFYARVPGVEHDGALASIGKKAKEGGVSINSFLRVSGSPISAGGSQVDYVLKTECCKLSKATKFMDSLRSEEWSNAAPILMPIL